MKRRNLIQLACTAAMASAMFSAPASAQPKDKVTLLLNWYVYSEHAPFFLGKEKGLYEAEGIDLDIQEGRGSAVSTQAVAANSATFGPWLDLCSNSFHFFSRTATTRGSKAIPASPTT